MQLCAFEFVDVRYFKCSCLERTYACGDEYCTGQKFRSFRGSNIKTAVFELLEFLGFFSVVESRIKGLDLFKKVVCEFLCRADWNGRNVIDRLVRVEFHTLTARSR